MPKTNEKISDEIKLEFVLSQLKMMILMVYRKRPISPNYLEEVIKILEDK
jgi:hypothetical protein